MNSVLLKKSFHKIPRIIMLGNIDSGSFELSSKWR